MSVVTESVCQDACSLKRKTKNLDNGYSGVYFFFTFMKTAPWLYSLSTFLFQTPFHFTLTSLQSRYYHPSFTDKELEAQIFSNLLKVTQPVSVRPGLNLRLSGSKSSYFCFTTLCLIYSSNCCSFRIYFNHCGEP